MNQIEIETESCHLDGNDWTPAGPYHTACFVREPDGVRGCPMGRSHVSVEDAIRNLLFRTNDESGTGYIRDVLTVVRHRDNLPSDAKVPTTR